MATINISEIFLTSLNISDGLRLKLLPAIGKRTSMLLNNNTITTVALGSSHGEACFNPNFIPNSLNLCFASQDLKHSYLLYEKSLKVCPNIHNVILFYSVFSSDSVLEKSPSEKEWSVAYNEVFELNLNYKDESLQSVANSIKGAIKDLHIAHGERGLPPYQASGIPHGWIASKRARDHMRFNRGIQAIGYLYQFLALAKFNNHNATIVLCPAHSEYKKMTGILSEFLFKNLFDVINNLQSYFTPNVLDFYNSDLILDEYFQDYDHLIPTGDGPRIIAEHINKLIKHND